MMSPFKVLKSLGNGVRLTSIRFAHAVGQIRLISFKNLICIVSRSAVADAETSTVGSICQK